MSFCGVVQVVTAHGICHLLGYRHESEEDWNEVRHTLPQSHKSTDSACHGIDLQQSRQYNHNVSLKLGVLIFSFIAFQLRSELCYCIKLRCG